MLVPSLRRMIEPFPYSFSLVATARSTALLLFLVSSIARDTLGERGQSLGRQRFSSLLRIRSAFKNPMTHRLEKRMSEKPPETPGTRKGEFDVVLMHGTTDDGAGTKVLRARPGRIETGEVRPMPDGRPLVPGGEVVRLERRKDAPAFFD